MAKELFNAVLDGDVQKVKDLVSLGCDLTYRDEHGNNILGLASLKMMELLIELGADPLLPTYKDHSLAGNAAFAGDYKKLEILLKYGADSNQVREETGEAPLHLATCKFNKQGTNECVKLLLENGGDPNQRTLEGIGSDCFDGNLWVVAETPLHRAASYGDLQMIQDLIKFGADISLKDCYGYLPLDWAARMWRNHDVLRLLGGEV